MKILGIETSCDETALCLIEGTGGLDSPKFTVLKTALFSQVKIHEQYGGVFPNLAKREHSKNLVPLLKNLLSDTKSDTNLADKTTSLSTEKMEYLKNLLNKEPELFETLMQYLPTANKPDIEAIAVTYGPGLEMALWVGINFAKALNYIWDIPIVAVNHMEGHIVSVLTTADKVSFPALALLISGGHTELVEIKGWTEYKVIGETKDDAVGEAFDKVARMLGLPYPGGPQISMLAEKDRKENGDAHTFTFPRPMIYSDDLNFSFSGLKTSVLYTIKKIPEITEIIKQQIARGFEDAVVDVLVTKTKKALEKTGAKTLIIGGGVIANSRIRESFFNLKSNNLEVLVPEISLTTDNAVMIAVAGYIQISKNGETLKTNPKNISAQGNLRL